VEAKKKSKGMAHRGARGVRGGGGSGESITVEKKCLPKEGKPAVGYKGGNSP